MTKFKMEIGKALDDQSWWPRLKPEEKLKAIKICREMSIDEACATGGIQNDPETKDEFVIDLSIPKRKMREGHTIQ
jgi:hypothetical protein